MGKSRDTTDRGGEDDIFDIIFAPAGHTHAAGRAEDGL